MKSSDDEFDSFVNNPHDAVFRAAFRKKEVAGAFFRHWLPENIRKHMNFDTLEITDATYVDEKLRDKHSDIVYKAKMKRRTVFLYLLFEHQSSPDPVMVFRVLCYMVNLWKEYRDQHPKTKKLPMIVPLVLYHGKRKWKAPVQFREMIRGYHKNFSVYIPDFSFQLFNLADYPDEMLVLGDCLELGAMLLLFRHIFDKDFGVHLERVMKTVARIRDPQISLEFLELALRYVYNARNDGQEISRRQIEQGIACFDSEKAKETAMTIAERIKRTGEKIGEKRGKKIGVYSVYDRMLRRRFGGLTPVLERKLTEADTDILFRFGDAILDFRDLNEAEQWWEKQGTAQTGLTGNG